MTRRQYIEEQTIDFRNFNYIFLVTYARSGSTLLQSLINSTPTVQIRGENNNALLHLYRSYKALHETFQRGKYGQQAEPDTPWYGAGSISPDEFLKGALNIFISNVLNPTRGIKVIGFKEIRYIPYYLDDKEFFEYMDFLVKTFPNIKIVCNSRNADSVRQSGWLKKEDSNAVREFVHACDRRFELLNVQVDSCIWMKYDEYTLNPEILEKLFSFLDLPYNVNKLRNVLDKPLMHAKN